MNGIPSFFQGLGAQPTTENQFPGNYNPSLGTMTSQYPVSMQQSQFAGFGGNNFLGLLGMIPGIGAGLQQLMNPTYSPMAMLSGQMQQAQFNQLRDMAWKRDNAEMAHRLQAIAERNWTGSGTINHQAAAQQAANMYQSVYSSPLTQMLFNAAPGVAQFVERQFGTPQAVMSANLFYSTRHLGFGVSQVDDISRTLRGNMWAGGQYQAAFAQGLTGREASEAYGELYSRNLMGTNQAGIDRTGGNALKMVASYRDMFGSNVAVKEAMSNIQQMTSGGLDQVDTGTLTRALDKMETVAKNANISFDIMQGLVTQGSRFARQMGLGGMAGVGITTAAVSASAATGTANIGEYWGKWAPREHFDMTQTMMFQSATSREGMTMAGILRLANDNPGNAKLQDIAANIKAGSVGSLDPKLRAALREGNAGVAAGILAPLVGMDAQATTQALNSDLANSQYTEAALPGIMETATRSKRQKFGRSFEATLSTRGITGKRATDLAIAAMSEFLGGTTSVHGITAIKDMAETKKGMIDKLVAKGVSKVDATSIVNEYVDKEDELNARYGGVDNFRRDAHVLSESERKKKAEIDSRERELKGSLASAGVGRSGGIVAKFITGMMDPGQKDAASLLLNALGAPNDIERFLGAGAKGATSEEQLIKILGSEKVNRILGTPGKDGLRTGGLQQQLAAARGKLRDPKLTPAQRKVVEQEIEGYSKQLAEATSNTNIDKFQSAGAQQTLWDSAKEVTYASGRLKDEAQKEVFDKHMATLFGYVSMGSENFEKMISPMTGGSGAQHKAAMSAYTELSALEQESPGIVAAAREGKLTKEQRDFLTSKKTNIAKKYGILAGKLKTYGDDGDMSGKSADDVIKAIGEGTSGVKATKFDNAVFENPKFITPPKQDP